MSVRVCVLIILGAASVAIATDLTRAFFTPRDTPCPSIPAIGDFNVSRYAGTWYENKRFTFAFQENTKCVRIKFFERDDGGFNIIFYRQLIWPRPVEIRTRLVLEPTLSPGTFDAKTKIGDNWVYAGTYVVVVAGYTDATMVYSCQDLWFETALEAAWIMTRDRGVLTSADETSLSNTATSLGINFSKFSSTSQSDCIA
ncbi:apolipoprotein D-like [Pecten maximus]|uniref:apolipoprotein D-like n=1 Tax=Pecten maximus TaxID=6579 RepID=UPI0014589B0B|nr:apolipoprotein D-like [Pecten maximus]